MYHACLRLALPRTGRFICPSCAFALEGRTSNVRTRRRLSVQADTQATSDQDFPALALQGASKHGNDLQPAQGTSQASHSPDKEKTRAKSKFNAAPTKSSTKRGSSIMRAERGHSKRKATPKHTRSRSSVSKTNKSGASRGTRSQKKPPMGLKSALKSLRDSRTTRARADSEGAKIKKKDLAGKITPTKAQAGKASTVKKPASKNSNSNLKGLHWTQSPSAASLRLTPIDFDQPPVPRLSYGLDRVLFNPGVYRLQDPRSRVYNFDPYLQDIMPASEFDFEALNAYTTSSQDMNLTSIAKDNQKRYTGSTSSMTSLLSHFHYLISTWREPNMSMLSSHFPSATKSFTNLSRSPAACFLKYNDGMYAIDADKELSTSSILSMLGKSMEKLLTLETSQYEKYRKSNSAELNGSRESEKESFHYSTIGDFVFRSQLDAHDPRLPGTGMFDLKTRAVVAVRMNIDSYMDFRDYEITMNLGEWESFEREYHDMIRAAFLKYSLQVRMGRMDGIFVAYHNTQRIFGFQYIPISEMDFALHGQSDTTLGDSEFKLSINLLNELLNRATDKYTGQSLRIYCETRGTESAPFMYFFAQPVTEQEMHDIQNTNRESQRQIEAALTNDDLPSNTNATPSSCMSLRQITQSLEDIELDPQNNWSIKSGGPLEEDCLVLTENSDCGAAPGEDEFHTELQETNGNLPEDNELDHRTSFTTMPEDQSLEDDPVIDIIEQLRTSDPSKIETLEGVADASIASERAGDRMDDQHEEAYEVEVHNGDKLASTADSLKSEGGETNHAQSEQSPQSERDLLCFVVRVQNLVGSETVVRPENLGRNSPPWRLRYSIQEISDPQRKWKLYEACRARRKATVARSEHFAGAYFQKLRQLSTKGKLMRQRLDKTEQGMNKILWSSQ